MNKLDKEFKSEVNQEFKKVDFIGRKITIRIVLIVLIVGLLGSIGGFAYKMLSVEKDREIFKNSTTYTEAAATFLADSYKEYNDAETDAEKNAIMQYVVMRYPNLNINTIENQTLRQFYNKCVIGG